MNDMNNDKATCDIGIILFVCLVIISLVALGLMLYSTSILLDSEQGYYEQIPNRIAEAAIKSSEQITANTTNESKLTIIEFNCKQYFPMRYGNTIEQSQCMQDLTYAFRVGK